MSRTLTDQAVRLLLERGWPILPSAGTRKTPCIRWKEFQERLPTEAELRGWDGNFRPSRWGLVTGKLSGVVVLDFDGENGVKLMRMWRIVPHIQTGSGGFHSYVQHPGWRVPTLNAKTSKKSWPWPGVDVRGDGGFAVLLGCNQKGPYSLLRELVPEQWDSLPQQLRQFLFDNSQDNRAPQSSLRTSGRMQSGRHLPSDRLVRDALEIATRDGRNNAGFWLACQLRDNGYDSSEAESAMREFRSRAGAFNTKGVREAYSAREMLASLRQAYAHPAREPWKKSNPHSECVRAGAASTKMSREGAAATDQKKARHLHLHADGSESISLYVVHTGEPLVGHTGEPLPQKESYSRVPREVSEDRRLKHRDRSVYAALASACFQGNVLSVGKRRIAVLACCAERLVVESLKRLEAAGHIQKAPGWCRGQRQTYILLSGVFGKKQRADLQETAVGPNGGLRLVTARKDQGTSWVSAPRRLLRPQNWQKERR